MDDAAIRSAASRNTRAPPASGFAGTALRDPMATPKAPSRTRATLVTFTPGARTNCHTHKTRQVPVAIQETGMVQAKGKPPRFLRAGDLAEVPPGLVHRHGAIAAHLVAHSSFNETDGPDNTAWMEPVDETHCQSVAAAPEA